MTEPNKELPKEVVDAIQKDMEDQEIYGLDYEFGLNNGAQIAQSHYAPIIEAKDREIEILKLDAKIIAHKDKVISRLKAEKAELHKMVSERDATISKLMGLLKDSRCNLYRAEGAFPDMYNELFEVYCKENGIDLGGE